MSKAISTQQKGTHPPNYGRLYSSSSKKEWSSFQHVMDYLDIIDAIPHRSDGEEVLLDHIPVSAKRVLDLGTGNGRLLKIIKVIRPNVEGVGVDISPTMLKAARENFAGDQSIKVVEHDLNNPLLKSKLGTFDIIVTSLNIHHLTHKRKHSIYDEIYSLLNQGGIFCNLEHIDSPTPSLHEHLPDLPGMNILTDYCQWILNSGGLNRLDLLI